MSSLEMRHPEDGQLLRYLDGELSKRAARQVRGHLEACWQCRAALEELQSTVADCVRYRKNVLGTCLPPPPNPWQDLSRGFDKIDAQLQHGSMWARLWPRMSRALSPPAIRWTATGTAVLALMGVIAYQWRETPAVQAAALLHKAVAAADSRPRPLRRTIRVKTRTGESTRVIGAGQQKVSETPAVAQMFRAANYDWDDPLSAKSYQGWRDHLAEKRDEVTQVDNSFRIHTATNDGELVAATLKFRMTDLEPTEGRFEFRNQDWVEMTESIDLQTLPASAVAGATGGMPRQPGMPPDYGRSTVDVAGEPVKPTGIAEELKVVAALHAVGADLGDPVEINRAGGQVLVSGTGIPLERQRQIHAALGAIPRVVVRFADPVAPVPGEAEPVDATTNGAAIADGARLQARLEERLGGRPQFERFSGQLLDWTDAAMSRAHALRRLAQQFPPNVEQELSLEDRRVLRNLAREHLAELARDSARIETTLRPVLASLGGAGAVNETGPDFAAWQPATEELLGAARRVETLLAVLFGMAPAENAAENVPVRITAALARLKINIERCQGMLAP